MRSRNRKRLGDSFKSICLGWILLPVSIVVGLAAAGGIAVDVNGPLFGFVLVFGWLLSFLTGVLQRIMPFLASMHSVRPGVKPILLSVLTADRPLRVHMVCHGAALALIAGGIVSGEVVAIRLGAAIGLVGALAFGWFAGRLWATLRRHLNMPAQPTENT